MSEGKLPGGSVPAGQIRQHEPICSDIETIDLGLQQLVHLIQKPVSMNLRQQLILIYITTFTTGKP